MFAVQLLEQGAANQGLAGTHFTGHLDEAFAFAQGHVQQVKARLIGRQLDQKSGIWRQRERFLA
ncbi:hypothetical protein D3C86_2077660 [compost metagenome]